MNRSLVLALVAAGILALPACEGIAGGGGGPGKGGGREGKGGRGHGKGGREGEPAEVMQVEVVHLRAGPIERWYRSSGTLEAIRSAELVAVQPAIIESVLVDEGDEVKEGQLLARLDGRALSLQASAATVELENLQAELRRLESVSKSAISQEEIDKQRYLVEQARANLKLSRHQAKQTVIRAPFSGTIVTRYADEGNMATTATPLFHLADLTVVELPLHLPERDAATVAVGTEVEVELIDGTTFTAKIERRAPVDDPLTGTVKFTMRTGPGEGRAKSKPKDGAGAPSGWVPVGGGAGGVRAGRGGGGPPARRARAAPRGGVPARGQAARVRGGRRQGGASRGAAGARGQRPGGDRGGAAVRGRGGGGGQF